MYKYPSLKKDLLACSWILDEIEHLTVEYQLTM